MSYDSHDREGAFKVYTTAGMIEFVSHMKDLHYHNLSKYKHREAMMVSTVRGNCERFTMNQINLAIEGCTCRNNKKPIRWRVSRNGMQQNDNKLPHYIWRCNKWLQNIWTRPCRGRGKTVKKNRPCCYGICLQTKKLYKLA